MDTCMKKRWILLDQDRGIFLGTYSPDHIGEKFDDLMKVAEIQDIPLYALFSRENPFHFDFAITFDTKLEAQLFAMDMFKGKGKMSISAKEVSAGSKFIHFVQLIKDGYEWHIGSMDRKVWDCANKTIH